MKTSRTRIVARYNETDKMGIIHHSQYVIWFEVARTDWIKQSGLSFRQIEERGLMMPVLGIEVHYHSPALFDDAVIVETTIKNYDSVKMSFSYKVMKEADGTLLVDGTSLHCWTDEQMRPISLRKKDPELHQLILNEAELS
ncbi:acyl-CoA thioesterase [Sporolactobacillus pectinivorans]|uniref:acyl-CoA thioesterase n=1 Tax=Sporolactobacillus pectinivorans TaxID=1591408 RepID=UPI000C26433A|nr:thioesterase family protein [Sporolactobacillus pectinivorans]